MFVVIYVVGGILVMRFVRGARGVEMIPHYTFWSDFPLLIRVSRISNWADTSLIN